MNLKQNGVIRLDGVIREWYGLQALSQILLPHLIPFNKRHERLMSDIDDATNAITDYLYDVLWDYIPMALCGEMSHSGRASKRYPRGARSFYTEGLTSIKHIVTNYSRNAIFELADKAFGFDMAWRSGYGGYRWQKIANTTFRYRNEGLPKAVWVDYVVDLQHNTGTVLSKRNHLFSLGGLTDFEKFLTLKRNASPEVVVMAAPNEKVFINLTRRVLSIVGHGVDEYLRSHKGDIVWDISDTVPEFGYNQAVLMLKAWGIGEILPPNEYYPLGITDCNYNRIDLWDHMEKYTPMQYGDGTFDLTIDTDFTDNEWKKQLRIRDVRMYGRDTDIYIDDKDPLAELMRNPREFEKYEKQLYQQHRESKNKQTLSPAEVEHLYQYMRQRIPF